MRASPSLPPVQISSGENEPCIMVCKTPIVGVPPAPPEELNLSWPYGFKFCASFNSPQNCTFLGTTSDTDDHLLWRIAGYSPNGATWIMETDLYGRGVGIHRHKYIKAKPQPMRSITGYVNIYRNGDTFSAGIQIHGTEQEARAAVWSDNEDWVGAKLIKFTIPATP